MYRVLKYDLTGKFNAKFAGIMLMPNEPLDSM